MSGQNNILYTVGHSNHTIEVFIELLKRHKIGMVLDVRSAPYSRYCSQFDKGVLAAALPAGNIKYEYLGKELGARPDDPGCYEGGWVNFERAARRKEFKEGVERVLANMGRYSAALMCSEKEPLECHRTILICRSLKDYKLDIKHILEDGAIEDHHDAERRLVKLLKIERTLFEPDLTESDLIEQAFDKQGRKISHKAEEAGGVETQPRRWD